jgi:hypothetical protein
MVHRNPRSICEVGNCIFCVPLSTMGLACSSEYAGGGTLGANNYIWIDRRTVDSEELRISRTHRFRAAGFTAVIDGHCTSQ